MRLDAQSGRSRLGARSLLKVSALLLAPVAAAGRLCIEAGAGTRSPRRIRIRHSGAGPILKRELADAALAAIRRLRRSRQAQQQASKNQGVFHRNDSVGPRRARVCALARLVRSFVVPLMVVGCSDGGPAGHHRYTGLWKTDCRDYWAVQIRPASPGQYSVTFCGLSGCLPPGSWMPDTSIDDDPRYEVLSSKKISIARPDGGHHRYVRCTTDPYWHIEALSATRVQ